MDNTNSFIRDTNWLSEKIEYNNVYDIVMNIIHQIYEKMGSGISLSHYQVVYMIERELERLHMEKENLRPRTTDDGYEIYYDFSEEAALNKTVRELHRFLRKTK